MLVLKSWFPVLSKNVKQFLCLFCGTRENKNKNTVETETTLPDNLPCILSRSCQCNNWWCLTLHQIYISLHYQTTFTIICLVYKTVVHRINKTQLSKARIIIYIIFNIQYLRRCSLHKTLVVAVIFRGGWATISFFSTKPQSYFCLKEAKHFGPLRLVFFLPQFLRNKSIPLKVLGQGPPATLQLRLCQKLPSC